MSSRFRNKGAIGGALLVLACLPLAGCNQSQSQASNLPFTQNGPDNVAISGLFPGGGSPPPEDPRGQLYEGKPQVISEGERLFDTYNCAGCHFHGAGGIGPPLLDHAWIYGSRIDQIFATIYQGRPNGMPSWAGKIPNAQIWDIAAYVRSLATTQSQEPIPTQKPLAVATPSTNPENGQQASPPAAPASPPAP